MGGKGRVQSEESLHRQDIGLTPSFPAPSFPANYASANGGGGGDGGGGRRGGGTMLAVKVRWPNGNVNSYRWSAHAPVTVTVPVSGSYTLPPAFPADLTASLSTASSAPSAQAKLAMPFSVSRSRSHSQPHSQSVSHTIHIRGSADMTCDIYDIQVLAQY